MSNRWVYAFGSGAVEGPASRRALLGGKGASLSDMVELGLPVPEGFTITTEACIHFYKNDSTLPVDLVAQVQTAVTELEAAIGRRLGDPASPLLVSVRSGAQASMPGMMDTVLNLGLNDETVEGLAQATLDRRFALDCYRRFITMYSSVVLGMAQGDFEKILDQHKLRGGCSVDTDVTADGWTAVIAEYKQLVHHVLGIPFPQDPRVQLWGAINAVFGSWMNDRAKFYRKMHDVPDDWGTAVNVQRMVFGNRGSTSATGVAFTRDPSTGEPHLFGEFLPNAQGEDVVAGIRTPHPLTRRARETMQGTSLSMEESLPEISAQLRTATELLEKHYRRAQDIEFTAEEGKLYILQTRHAKLSLRASLKIAVDMVRERIITPREAVIRIDPSQLDQLLHPMVDPKAARVIVAHGLPASPGAASGRVVFTADETVRLSAAGEDVVLVRDETSPEDIHGMYAARAIVTARGGMTSHAAVVARGMGRPCVAGASDMSVDCERGEFQVRGKKYFAGDIITVDGSTGQILLGAAPMIAPELPDDFRQIMRWADEHKTLGVLANAETPKDARAAREFGAQGIGLCRTEHMFFDDGRIAAMREMILADDEAGRRGALVKILPMQRGDFIELFTIMSGLPVVIRLLDPPLHEFLPHSLEEVKQVARATGISEETLYKRGRELAETNPMLGWRGCRLGITFPEIYEMQIRAIFEAACAVKDQGFDPIPEIMHPLVSTREEMVNLKALTVKVADEVLAACGQKIAYKVGTMIELPRAALLADRLAESAEFFSFGTNDLTQTTYGISRDDSSRFLNPYIEKGVFAKDPFVTLDQEGVGALIDIAVTKGRDQRSDIKLGLCGEHGGDPASIAFCHRLGLTYVSCSPYRIFAARLAAAQAAIASGK